ncbi:hypothetical protein SSPNP10_34140 [Streptomyces sp. NP10]|nr:hypothetical protein SSPNP10_34140 [Streptomyces sp. NP10]
MGVQLGVQLDSQLKLRELTFPVAEATVMVCFSSQLPLVCDRVDPMVAKKIAVPVTFGGLLWSQRVYVPSRFAQ